MTKQRLGDLAKRIAVSFSLSAAVLSIANIDTIWEERIHRTDDEVVQQATRQKLRARLQKATASQKVAAGTDAQAPSQLDRLRAVLAQDELGGVNPYAELSTLDPVTEVLKLGVVDFKRQAYRSSQYKDEVGYDLVEYEIEHADKSKSTIMAYLERPLTELNPEELVPVVIVMRAHQGAAKQALFRSGNLIEQTDLTLAQVQSLVNQKVNAGIPFISVSR